MAFMRKRERRRLVDYSVAGPLVQQRHYNHAVSIPMVLISDLYCINKMIKSKDLYVPPTVVLLIEHKSLNKSIEQVTQVIIGFID